MTRPMPGPPEDCYCRFGNATCQECETRGYPYSWGLCPGCELHNGRDLGAYKRLKDVECAAEYWRAEAHFLLDLHGYEYELDPVPADHNFVKWLETCVRFDTHRHELEES